MTQPILPGSTIGIFGSGQLGRMMALAAKRMGYRIHVFSPERDSPTGQVADREIVAEYDDDEAVAKFAGEVDVVTFEFENVDARVVDVAREAGVSVHPSGYVLRTAQNRILEKSTLEQAGLPVTPFIPIRTETDLTLAAARLNFPIVLKTATSGYDGKGQVLVQDAAELHDAWEAIDRAEAVAEMWIPLHKEISVVAARRCSGDVSDYGATENVHVNHILDLSVCPAQVPDEVAREAREIAHCVLEKLEVVGVTCVEFFLTSEGTLLINEIAPRPHNSGHHTIEAAVTSQFEQHIRAICGLPLGATTCSRPAAMVNLLGDLWENGTPDWKEALAHPDVKLHLYGKHEPRQGRKMGHLTVVATDAKASIDFVRNTALAARAALK